MSPDFIKTICPYCGVGCGLVLKVEDGKVVGTYPDREHPVSRGTLCIKGWSAHEFIHHPERLKTPLVKKGDTFEEISWDDAIALAAEKLKAAAESYGGDAVGGLSSAKCTNEENYLFQKMIRMAFKTNNVDHCARLCHAPTAVGMGQTTGSGAMTNSISDLAGAECILIIGSNAAESHPIIMGEIYKAVDQGAAVIVVDPRKTAVAENARIHLRINPGTDIPLLTGMMRHIIDAGLHNEKFIKDRMEGFDELKKFLQSWPVERAAKECGIDEGEIRRVAEIYAKAKDSAAVYCMGITQHACGTANVHAVCDLAMLCGQIGKTFSGVYPLRGQNNVQGACDMGALPNVYPGYQSVSDPAVKEKFEKAWGRELSRQTRPYRNGDDRLCRERDTRALHHGREPRPERSRCEPRTGISHEAGFPDRPGYLSYGDGEIRRSRFAGGLLCRKDGDVHEHGKKIPALEEGGGTSRRGKGRLRDYLSSCQRPGARFPIQASG